MVWKYGARNLDSKIVERRRFQTKVFAPLFELVQVNVCKQPPLLQFINLLINLPHKNLGLQIDFPLRVLEIRAGWNDNLKPNI